jgi:hypothetical protein
LHVSSGVRLARRAGEGDIRCPRAIHGFQGRALSGISHLESPFPEVRSELGLVQKVAPEGHASNTSHPLCICTGGGERVVRAGPAVLQTAEQIHIDRIMLDHLQTSLPLCLDLLLSS